MLICKMICSTFDYKEVITESKDRMHTYQQAPRLNNTWVFIDFVDQVKLGVLKSIKVMDRELVLWRTQTGKISLMDAYCTHMGAHLGKGKIKGELLECHFHKRCFNIKGLCQGNGKSTQTYPITINDNMIFAWFGTQDPSWQIPSLLKGFPGNPESQWTMFKYHLFNFNFHCKNMAENGVDGSHFKIYHQFCESYEPTKILEITPYRFITQLKLFGYPMLRKLKIPHEVELVSENWGACSIVINNSVKMPKRSFYFKFFYLATPTEDRKTKFTLCMLTQCEPNKKLSVLQKIFNYGYFSIIFKRQIQEFYRESKEVWESKSCITQPDYMCNEPAMKQFHDWYRQYYL